MEKIEYRVRPVTRFIVTRYHEETDAEGRGCGGVSTIGEYHNESVAFDVGYACCKAEHDRLGWEPGDMRIIYPVNNVPGVRVTSPITGIITGNTIA